MNRVWQWVLQHQKQLQTGIPDLEAQQHLHQTIHKVSEDIKSLKYNTAIAALMTHFNTLQAKSTVFEVELKSYLLMLAPFAPHVTEELWHRLGESSSIHRARFPQANPEFLIRETVTIAVQINGCTRTTITLPPDASQAEAIDLAEQVDAIQRRLANREVRRVIYVPGRILNLIV